MRALGLWIAMLVGTAAVAGEGMEWNTDRMGADYDNFDMRAADPAQCQQACASDTRCQAWTYVRPNTIQGPRPRCWRKSAVPSPRGSDCCVSGVIGAELEWNTDRMGADYTNFDLPTAEPKLCQSACTSDGRCRAWTYVHPNTIQGPNPRCWLKTGVPAATSSNCCVSGVK